MFIFMKFGVYFWLYAGAARPTAPGLAEFWLGYPAANFFLNMFDSFGTSTGALCVPISISVTTAEGLMPAYLCVFAWLF